MCLVLMCHSSNDFIVKPCAHGRHEIKVNVGAQLFFSVLIYSTPENEYCMNLNKN